MKYKTAASFRAAIEERISNISKKDGIDLQRLQRDIAFDRLLVRLFQLKPTPWALKGGYAMQLRTESARATKDIDLALKDANLFDIDISKRNEAIRETLQKQAVLDLGDYFSFIISPPTRELMAAPEGGVRFNIEARIADRTFAKFLLDIGAGDVWSESLELLDSSDLLEFAGFKSQKFPAIPKEQQFAEKLHAYTLPRSADAPNSRVKDLIDMNLLINDYLNPEQLSKALKDTFERRGTHKIPMTVQPPPQAWGATFTLMAQDCGLNPDINVGFKTLADYLKKL